MLTVECYNLSSCTSVLIRVSVVQQFNTSSRSAKRDQTARRGGGAIYGDTGGVVVEGAEAQ